jgi:hypothetical protein
MDHHPSISIKYQISPFGRNDSLIRGSKRWLMTGFPIKLGMTENVLDAGIRQHDGSKESGLFECWMLVATSFCLLTSEF